MRKPLTVSVRRISIRRSTQFKSLPVYLSAPDISAWLKVSPTDAQALMDSAPRQYPFDGVPKISKYQLMADGPRADLIKLMQRYPNGPCIKRLARAAVEKILNDPTHPQYKAFQKEWARYAPPEESHANGRSCKAHRGAA
jgi:hypothetical protein